MAAESDSSVEQFLRSEFTTAIKGLDGDDGAIEKWTNSLIKTYTEPQRHYHTITHICSMLRCLASNEDSIKDTTAIQLAIFFHDWVYDPKAHDNEVRSVRVFQTFANEFHVEETLYNCVCHYIEATITHSIATLYEDDQSLKLFLDFDLEVLARDPPDYALYAAQIRQEYGYFSNVDYALGRVGVLEKFLGRERLFFSDGFSTTFEERARDNLRMEIAELKKTYLAS